MLILMSVCYLLCSFLNILSQGSPPNSLDPSSSPASSAGAGVSIWKVERCGTMCDVERCAMPSEHQSARHGRIAHRAKKQKEKQQRINGGKYFYINHLRLS